MSALPAGERQPRGCQAEAEWAQIGVAAPPVAAVMHRYLRQLGTFLAPASVEAADNALRHLARWMITQAGLAAVGDIRRDDIEDFKVWLAARPRAGRGTITAETHRQRMRTIRQFFERIVEWDWPDAPARNPVIAWDIPKKPEPRRLLDTPDLQRPYGDRREAPAWSGAPLMSTVRSIRQTTLERSRREGVRPGQVPRLEQGRNGRLRYRAEDRRSCWAFLYVSV